MSRNVNQSVSKAGLNAGRMTPPCSPWCKTNPRSFNLKGDPPGLPVAPPFFLAAFPGTRREAAIPRLCTEQAPRTVHGNQVRSLTAPVVYQLCQPTGIE